MKRALYVLAAAVVLGSTMVVIAAQQPAQATDSTQLPFTHGGCAATTEDGKPQPHVPPNIAQALALTPEQNTEVERLITEGCTAMMRTHHQILNLLTPEQRAKMDELHSGGSLQTYHQMLMDFFKKLHGK